mgnify:FL=1|jgi:hypothetical protein
MKISRPINLTEEIVFRSDMLLIWDLNMETLIEDPSTGQNLLGKTSRVRIHQPGEDTKGRSLMISMIKLSISMKTGDLLNFRRSGI